MNDISNLSKLSFFKVSNYAYDTAYTCDFRNIPRPHYCMGLIIKGEGKFCFDEETVTVKSGDIIFVPVGSTYISRWKGEPDIFYISVHFSFEAPDPFSRSKKIKIQKISPPDFEEYKAKYEFMYKSYEGSEQVQFSALSMFYSIMSHVYPLLKYITVKKIDSRIEKAAEYIDCHYKEEFSVAHLANISNMSVSHFYSCFKSSVGYSPIEYKHKVCIRHAELMLIADAEKSIEEISEALGFSSSSYFRQIFKKITGESPRRYRKFGAEL